MKDLTFAGMNPDTLLCAGINMGRGNTKVKTDQGYFQYTSDVNRAADRRFQERLGMDSSGTQLVKHDGMLYEVGEGASLSSAPRERKAIFPKWAGTEPYMVLRQSVLDRLAMEGADWVVTLGVTIKELDDDEYVELVRSLWIGEHETARGKICIHAAHVAAEPSGALFYYGTNVVTLETLRKQNLTVLDFGYFTTLGTTHNRLHPDKDNTFQLDFGVSRVVEHVTEAIRKDYREDRDVVEIEMAMLGKWTLSIDNHDVDMKPYTERAVQRVGPSIITQMRTKMPRPASQMYLVGGGTHLFGELTMQAYADRKVTISDKPQQANAYGLWVYSQYRRAELLKQAA